MSIIIFIVNENQIENINAQNDKKNNNIIICNNILITKYVNIIMTCAIIGFIISYLFVKLTVGNSVDITGEPEFTLTEKLQASFLIFLFAGYWIVLLAKYLISLI